MPSRALVVSRFIEGKVFAEADVRANIGRIADLIRRFHDEMPACVTGAGFMFWVFHVIRDYARTLAASRNPHGRAAARAARARRRARGGAGAAADRPRPPRPAARQLHRRRQAALADRLRVCRLRHRDVRPRRPRLQLRASTTTSPTRCSTTYFGSPPDDALRRSHAAMQCASLLREAMWSLVSEMYLERAGRRLRRLREAQFRTLRCGARRLPRPIHRGPDA